ncbi:hypothetical protein [Geobacter sp. DSM 9736]|uniref:hypothetical protein n=1 Tax=Geobacter sp. DSM 9736 TaxID=1277350 RepID=UPI000B503243|nr:hypothetical protein [Geobacter sp. DSM 9736]SNB47024.1 hypothetical protein SAMN06269301_2498 [Geobacter sp. DSM 9736]
MNQLAVDRNATVGSMVEASSPDTVLVDEVLKDAITHLTELRQATLETAKLFRTGHEQQAKDLYLQVVTGLDLLVATLDCIWKVLDLKSDAVLGGMKPLSLLVEEFNSHLNTIVTAQQKKDWVFLSDLLEYELADHLNCWDKVINNLAKH